ncbi:clathrin assembly protein [Pyrus ussuriensis x Pyrus communis]|uniref:Clathrin assembly protein n=1 Tax=Pyrus ussuriensis x Pyrus communis TaxID=2448454 RepID=A0A5N5F4E5_9ROSA|nr:clathrin assembly protein [Pyrus ussuriensis x Pyrus communis]
MSQEEGPASEKHVREILTLTSSSRSYVRACLLAVLKRLIHHLLNDGGPMFGDEISHATNRSLEPIGFPIPSPNRNSSS